MNYVIANKGIWMRNRFDMNRKLKSYCLKQFDKDKQNRNNIKAWYMQSQDSWKTNFISKGTSSVLVH